MTEIGNTFVQWVSSLGDQALRFLIKAAIAVLIYIVVYFITKKICKWLRKTLEKMKVDPSICSFLVSIAKYAILIFTVFTIVVNLDIVQASSIAALIASAMVGITVALQGGLSNFAGGVLLLLLKPFKAGDYIIVKASGVEGSVEKIEMYYTTITDVENKVHMIPNSALTGNAITNLTAKEKRHIVQTVGISYDADLKTAKKILEKLMREHPQVLQDEPIQVMVSELGESAVSMGYRCWTKTEDYWMVLWSLNEQIKHALDEAGIAIPFNQLDVHIKENGAAALRS